MQFDGRPNQRTAGRATAATGTRLYAAVAIAMFGAATAATACCPAPHRGEWVVNADQTVVILWDAAKQTQHFIRQASFAGDGRDFGFIIPSPSVPELAEAGNAAFPYLKELTKPAVTYRNAPSGGLGCGCSDGKSASVASGVAVLAEKRVAGFDAAVLDAASADDLVQWLADHGYDYSPQVKAWAEPYVARGWKFTALKVAKDDEAAESREVDAAALRLSFATDAPLFPYREPDYGDAVSKDARRTLRIYFLGESRYAGSMEGDASWSGRTVWSDVVRPDQRAQLLRDLQLPADTGPAEMRLTEFEDVWPYRVAPSDVTFTVAADQGTLHRDPVVLYTQATSRWPIDATAFALAALVAATPVWLRRRKNL